MNKFVLLIWLFILLSLSGCATVTKRDMVKSPEAMGRQISARWLRHNPGSFSGDKKQIAVEIVRKLKTICSPVEWEAVRLFGGRNLESFTLANECCICDVERPYWEKFKDHENDLKNIIEIVLKEIPPLLRSAEYQGSLSMQLTYLDDDFSTGETVAVVTNAILSVGSAFILGAVMPVLNYPVNTDVTLQITKTNGETMRANGVGAGSIHGLTSFFYDKVFKKGFIHSFAEAFKVAAVNLSSHNFILLR